MSAVGTNLPFNAEATSRLQTHSVGPFVTQMRHAGRPISLQRPRLETPEFAYRGRHEFLSGALLNRNRSGRTLARFWRGSRGSISERRP
jgi:hypothetical protein